MSGTPVESKRLRDTHRLGRDGHGGQASLGLGVSVSPGPPLTVWSYDPDGLASRLGVDPHHAWDACLGHPFSGGGKIRKNASGSGHFEHPYRRTRHGQNIGDESDPQVPSSLHAHRPRNNRLGSLTLLGIFCAKGRGTSVHLPDFGCLWNIPWHLVTAGHELDTWPASSPSPARIRPRFFPGCPTLRAEADSRA